ncbi:hypothetical protein Tco_0618842, partial [Tanacetum coccineum]
MLTISTSAGIIGYQDTRDRTTIPIHRIFDRFRNMRTPSHQSDHVTRADIPCHMVSKQPLIMLNHSYLCLDADNHIVRPQIINFERSDGGGGHRHHLPAEHSCDRTDSAPNEYSITTHNDCRLNAEVETLLDGVDGNRLPTIFERDGTT